MTRKMNQLLWEKQAQAAEVIYELPSLIPFGGLRSIPIFLYNTMDMINWMAQQGRTSEVCNAVQSLSRFYKLTLSRKKGESVRLPRKKNHVSIYVHLQNMRYHDNISFISDIPDELMEYQIPKWTLQPVIENSILRHSGKTFQVWNYCTYWMDGGWDIVLLISDDGVGISQINCP